MIRGFDKVGQLAECASEQSQFFGNGVAVGDQDLRPPARVGCSHPREIAEAPRHQ